MYIYEARLFEACIANMMRTGLDQLQILCFYLNHTFDPTHLIDTPHFHTLCEVFIPCSYMVLADWCILAVPAFIQVASVQQKIRGVPKQDKSRQYQWGWSYLGPPIIYPSKPFGDRLVYIMHCGLISGLFENMLTIDALNNALQCNGDVETFEQNPVVNLCWLIEACSSPSGPKSWPMAIWTSWWSN